MIRVIGDRVLVALPPEPDELTTASGIVLVRDPEAARKPTQGIVIELGEKAGAVDIDDVLAIFGDSSDYKDWMVGVVKDEIRALRPAPFDVAVGDCVLFPLGAGEELEFEGVRYVLLREDEIIGVVEPKAEAA